MKKSRSKCSFLSSAILALGALLLSAAPASAQLSWTWSYSCSTFDTGTKCKGGSGTFTTTAQQGSGGSAYFVVTAITGTVEGNPITSLLAPDSLGLKNDNKLSSPLGIPYVNSGSKVTGIGFLTNNDPATDANANNLYQLFIDSEVGYDTQISGPDGLALESIDFKPKKVSDVGVPAPVPEPSSFILLALGAFAFSLLHKRQRA
jgi:hypothetical protein